MSVLCDVCCKAISAAKERVFCFGGCGQVLHAKCADLTSAGETALRENLSIKYMCHDCRKKQVSLNDMVGKCDSILNAINEIKNRLEKIEAKLERNGCDEAVKQCEQNMKMVVEESAKLHGEQLKILESQIAISANSPAIGKGQAEGDEYPSGGSFVEVVRRKKNKRDTGSVLRSGRVRNRSVATPDKNDNTSRSAKAQPINNANVKEVELSISNKKFGCKVRVKPIATQSNHQTKKDVRNIINPTQMGIKSVRNGVNGSIIVECGNEDEAEGFVKMSINSFES